MAVPGDIEGVDSDAPIRVVHTRRGRVILIAKWLSTMLLLLLIAAFLVAWVMRKSIADDLIADELEKRGVQGSYTLDRVGFRRQEISNLVIGDPANPDLTVRKAVIQVRIKWNGAVEVYRVAARGVRLKARVVGNKVSFGQIDKLLPPPSGKPFTLPNMVVDLTDATIALATPYGPTGFALEGRGNLSGGFKGRLAAAAPRLRPGACQLDQFRASVALGVEARRPSINGPIGAVRFACPASRLLLDQPRMDVKSTFTEAFDTFDGSGRLTVATFQAGVNGLAGMTSALTFKGSPTDITGRIELGAREARLAQVFANRTRFDGAYRLDARRGALVAVGDFGSGAVALDPSFARVISDPLRSARGTPLGPIGESLARTIETAARRFDVNGTLRLVNQRGGGGVRIERAEARTPAGGVVNVSGGDGVTYYWPGNRIRVDGVIETRGGGLPAARVVLSQPRSGAPLSGSATLAPFAAGGARLQLAPVRFAAEAGGWTRVSTVALLDGPFAGGGVSGLRLPISGRFGRGGALRFGEGCLEARFQSLRTGTLRLGPTRLPLCATQGAILRKAGGGPLALDLASRPIRLRGSLGSSPFALDGQSLNFSMGSGFLLRSVAARMGRADAPVLINAETVRGRLAGSGARGTFAGGDALIGKVPVALSEASGDWSVRGGDLDLNGALTVSDRGDPSRFYPLRSDNVRLKLIDGVIRANGLLKHPDSGTPVTDVAILHNLGSGVGNATLDVDNLRFGSALQPAELTRIAEGVVALVNGSVSGQGRINWSGSGDVTSTGEFTTDGMDFAASFGPVTGLKGTIRFSDLLGLQTAPGQTFTVATVNPGILVENGVIRYQLLPDNLVRIERGEWPFMGGRLILQETILNFGRDAPRRLTFEVVGLDARIFVDSMGFKEIQASGVFDGVLPMIFDEQGGRVVGGRLDSRPGGGTLAYNGVVNRANLGTIGSLAFDALRDLRFRSMIIRLDGFLDGEFATRLTIEGVGLGNTSTQRLIRSLNKIPLKFNVTIRGPFRALIATAKSFRDATDVISPALPRPLDEIPGIVVETRRREEAQQQSQTPVDQRITTTPTTSP
jgi:translocation and assembly module TamB